MPHLLPQTCRFADESGRHLFIMTQSVTDYRVMRLASLKRLFQINPEDRITSLAALFCASLLVGLAARIIWVSVEGPIDHPKPAIAAQP